MLALMNRSMDLIEVLSDEGGIVVRMNRRGYLYVTADQGNDTDLENASNEISNLGAGPLRVHSASTLYYQPASSKVFHVPASGADLLMGSELLRKNFPYLNERAVSALQVRRAGRLSTRQSGGTAPTSLKRDTTPHVWHRAIGVNSSLLFYEACGVQS
jgi:hypothetical protein